MKDKPHNSIISLYLLVGVSLLSASRANCQSHLGIQTVPMLTITGDIGASIEIQFATNLVQPNAWMTLTNFTVTNSPFYFVDTSATGSVRRFYRTALQNPDPGNLVWIPAGSFLFGSPASEQDRDPDEGPQTLVTLTSPFWMSKHEVTQADYLTVMSNNPSFFTGDSNRPVERVTWGNATNYCGKLTVREQQAGRLPAGYVYRLPTEAEWEYACRAGTTNRFSWGDDPGYTMLADHAWYAPNSGGVAGFYTHAVRLKLPNPWGLYDMNGNVWEWCWDFGSESLPGGAVTDPTGPASGPVRVLRGGWWSDPTGAICRSASRNGSGGTLSAFGFRVVLAKPIQPQP